MVLSKYIQLAVLGTALLFPQHAQATFDFTECVGSCVASSGCNTNNARCMCKEARSGLLLDSVISCLFFSCKSDLRNFEDSFLGPIEEGCEDSDRDIPGSKLRAAESLASSYISKLPATTTAAAKTTLVTSTAESTTATPNPTTKADAKTSSTATEQEESSTSTTADRGVEESTSTPAAEETTAAPTPVVAPSPSTEVSASTATETPDSGSRSGSRFDTDPFGTTSSTNAGSATQPFLYSLLGLPLAVGMLALR